MKTLEEIYENYKDGMGCGDKGTTHSYIEYYQALFEPYRETYTDILEIGVAPFAYSIRMWNDYFTNATIHGIDIRESDDGSSERSVLRYNDDKIKVNVGDASKKQDIDRLFLHNTFDFILDDGGHSLRDQLMSFKYLFPKVKPGGLYLIEDIQEFHEPAIADIFKDIHPNVEIVDRRYIKNRYDDIIVVVRKDK